MTDATAIAHGDHVVQFYEHESELVAGVGAYLIDAAREGAAAVVIATEAHRAAFARHLDAHGVDAGTIVMLDAAETLARFMPGGRIDREAFFDVVGGLVRDAGASGRPVRAYGEMVALLWDAGQVLAAIDLETLWNELGEELPFSLYCAYPSESVAGHEHAEALHQVCRLHAAVAAAPGEAVDAEADFPLDPTAVTAARGLVTDAMRGWGHDPAMRADAELVACELAANAILHARTPFRVSVHRYGPVVRIAVHDRAATMPAVLAFDAKRHSGRGMPLISAMARRWGVEVTPEGKTVWAELGP
jgi:anti-sigma regulatory factor (Ser/Thr protein kinase)